MEDISIAMATFNGGRFIRQQLDSLASQTHSPAELVISDDGSTDDTVSIAEAFAAAAPFPVHIHRNAGRSGYRRNFMHAASLCAGGLIAFCDQDDIWHAEKLATIRTCFDDPATMLVHHDAIIVDAAGRQATRLVEPGRFPVTADIATADPWQFALGFCQVFRRDLLAFSSLRECSVDFYFPGEHLAHDQWFFFLASVFGRIVYLDQALVDYRQHGGNAYGAKPPGSRLAAWLREAVENGGPFFHHLAAAAASKASILHTIAQENARAEAVRARAAAGARRYRDLADALELRSATYLGHGLNRRLTPWLHLWRQESYRGPGPWSFSGQSALRDAALGVLLAPALRNLSQVLPATSGERAH